MSHVQAATPGRPLTLPAGGVRAISFQLLLLLAAAYALPALAHLAGVPVRLWLPMHWPVLLAGLVYGWRTGGLIGLLAPAVSFGLSGYPRPGILPAMTVELAVYGCLAGYARQGLRWNALASTGVALLGGRLVFIAAALLTGAALPTPGAYLRLAVLPGLVAAAAQLLTLPLLARWWVRSSGSPRA